MLFADLLSLHLVTFLMFSLFLYNIMGKCAWKYSDRYFATIKWLVYCGATCVGQNCLVHHCIYKIVGRKDCYGHLNEH